MHTRHHARRHFILTVALVATAVVLGANGAQAKQFPVDSAPPPMPEAMRQQNEARAEGVLNALPAGNEGTARVNGENVRVREVLSPDAGFAVQDTEGGYLRVPVPVKPFAPSQTDARELKLKIRELAEQLIANMDPALQGVVAVPTSFVNQENFSQSSPLGRFIAEQLYYEFNQRCFPVREYRLGQSVTFREDEGEFLLSRKVGSVPIRTAGTVFVVGTYFIDRQSVFVNARLVNGSGSVLRTAQVILPNTAMTRRMLAGGSGKTLPKGSLPVQDYTTTTQPTNITPFDKGEDVH